jgi:hypothetical protein
MRARWSALAAFLAVGITYVAYPYVTLFRLGEAIRQGDAATLQTLVDWPAVREGIKEDICDMVIDSPVTTQEGGNLPPFGASFVRGIAANTIDRHVTPEALVAAVSASPRKQIDPSGANVAVNWAFFEDPTQFLVSLSAQGQSEPIKLEMRLHDGQWRVRRVWLPAELLQGNAKT